MDSKYIDVCEKLDFTVSKEDDDGTVNVSFCTPAGEDFNFAVMANNFVEEVKAYALAFDTEDHVEMLIMAKCNGLQGVPSVRRLIEDADAINEALNNLWIALEKADDQTEARGGAE